MSSEKTQRHICVLGEPSSGLVLVALAQRSACYLRCQWKELFGTIWASGSNCCVGIPEVSLPVHLPLTPEFEQIAVAGEASCDLSDAMLTGQQVTRKTETWPRFLSPLKKFRFG